jgi:5-methylcytosine-specific restriction endonuclease McrBC regulatory subunit McrC
MKQMEVEYNELYPEEPETRVIKSCMMAISSKFNLLLFQSQKIQQDLKKQINLKNYST